MTIDAEPAYAVNPEPVGGPPVPGRGRRRRRIFAGLVVLLLAVAGVAAVLVATGRVGPPAHPLPRVAFVGPDGALAIVDGQGGHRVDHASANTTFGFPAWSPDGSRVAVVATTPDTVAIDVFSMGPDGSSASDAAVVYQSATDAPFYLYWTPDSRAVTFLTANGPDLSLQSVPADGSAAARVLRQGQPMYWAWEGPDRMFVHTGSDTDAFLGAVGMDGTTMSTVAGLPGVFRAPSASADGRYDAYVVAPSPNTEAVVVGTSDGSTSHQIPVFGPAAVGFAPSGPQVAFIAPGAGDRVAPLPLGPVRIADASTGDVRALAVKDVVAFFWSPDGKTIATLGIPSTVSPPAATVGRAPATARLAAVRDGSGAARPSADAAGVDVSLQFVDVASGAATTPAIVSLSSLFVNQVLPYFDQYALSHRVWSPDGTSILLPVVTADGVETLESLPKDGSSARVLAPGSIGFWSP